MKELAQQMLELCWEIEKLPCSEQQTKCSVIASSLHSKLYDLAMAGGPAKGEKP